MADLLLVFVGLFILYKIVGKIGHYEGLVAVIETQKYNERLWNIGQRLNNPIKKSGNIMSYLSLLVVPLMLAMVLLPFYKFVESGASLDKMKEFDPLEIALPGTEVQGMYIPILEGLIAIFSAVVIHEFSHAIAATSVGLKIKRVVLVMFTFLPGAGVDIDEEEMATHPYWDRIRIYAAGPMINILAALFLFFGTIGALLLIGVIDGLLYEGGWMFPILYKMLQDNHFIFSVINWVVMFNLGIGLANLIPLYPLDGGRIFYDSVKHIWGDSGTYYVDRAMVVLAILVIALILL